MTISKKIVNNELYVYMNGELIYKRWLDTGESKVFDIMAYDKYTLMSIRDLRYDNPPSNLLAVKASITLRTPEDGGRKTGIISGYRPNHVFDHFRKDELIQTFIGEISFEGQSTIEPGETKIVTIRFLLNQPIEKYLSQGRKWRLQEGDRIIGEAEMLLISDRQFG